MGVRANYTATYSERTPYVSLQEVKFSPTASSLDFTNLVENGNQQAQDRALYDTIVRASAMADAHVTGVGWGTIGASLNSESGRTQADRYGRYIIKPQMFPILEVTSFQYGILPGISTDGGMTNVPLSSTNCWVEPSEFIITAIQGFGAVETIGGLTQIAGSYPNFETYVNYTYVNGWPNAFLTGDQNAGSTSLTVSNTVGMYAGTQLPIWDGMNTETVYVQSVTDATHIALTSPTQYRHANQTNISAVPPQVKQAVIHFVVGMIKERGQGGIVLAENGFEEARTTRGMSYANDYALGYDLLEEIKAYWGRQ